MNWPRILPSAVLFGLGLALTSASAGTVELRPVADTTLQSAFPTFNFGGGTTMTAGGRRFGGQTRALMLFDVAGNLPADAVINSVSLEVGVVRSPSGVVASTFDLNRLTASWGEGTGQAEGGVPAGPDAASWNDRFGSSGSPWNTPGGDFWSVPSGSTRITGLGFYTFNSTPPMIADVQSWLNDPANNFGWVMLSESEMTPVTIERFGSHEDKDNSPLLTIQYTVVPEPSTVGLLGFGLIWLVLNCISRLRPD